MEYFQEKAILPYSFDECMAETNISQEELKTLFSIITRKKNAIFYGPPGTGKTFLAKKIAQYFASQNNGFIQIIQFHPSYSYEDFIEGIRPSEGKDGVLVYKMIPGYFLRFCEQAIKFEGNCVLIIDEINRANLGSVFGELTYLLEYRNESIKLTSGNYLQVPDNVIILATMNTADRSIAIFDYALRRRFAFIEVAPDYEILKAFHHETSFIKKLIEIIERINKDIADKHFYLGISFFMVDDLEEMLESIWKTEIEPYLEEYFFGNSEIIENYRWAVIADVLL